MTERAELRPSSAADPQDRIIIAAPAELRLAAEADAAAIARVHVAARKDAYRDLLSPDALASENVYDRRLMWDRRLADAEGRCWLVEDAGGPFGFAYTTPARDEDLGPGCAELVAIYLLADGIGQGHGRRLVAHALEDLARRGFGDVVLWVAEENRAAAEFYARVGFVTDTRQPVVPFGETGLRKRRLRRSLRPSDTAAGAD